MPGYSTYRVAELRQLCEQRGLDHAGKRKSELIVILQTDDNDYLRGRGDNYNDDVASDMINDGDNEMHDEMDDGSNSLDDHESNNSDMEEEEVNNAISTGQVLGEDSRQQGGDVMHNGTGVHGLTRTDLLTSTAGHMNPREVQLQIELERERRETLRLQLEVAQAQRDAARNNGAAIGSDVRNTGNASDIATLKSLLPVMSDNDVLVFFLTFERICQINNIDKSMWARLLTPQLTGQGMKVFLRLSSDDAKDYDAAKRAILAYYKLNAQQYLKMFRSMKRTGRDTYCMTLNKLKDMQLAYFEAKNIKSLEDLADANLQEQLLNSFSNEVREFVWARSPRTADECAEIADLFYDVSRINDNVPRYALGNRNASRPGTNFGIRTAFPRPGFRPTAGGTAQFMRRPDGNNAFRSGTSNFQQPRQFYDRARPTFGPRPAGQGRGNPGSCYTCGDVTHRSAGCPRRFMSPLCPLCNRYHTANIPCTGLQRSDVRRVHDRQINDEESKYLIPTFVNNTETVALRDSGCPTPVLVDESLVNQEQIIPGKSVKLCGAFDSKFREFPVAKISLKCPRIGIHDNMVVEAVVVTLNGNANCIIGNKLFSNFDFLTDIFCTRHCDYDVAEQTPTHSEGAGRIAQSTYARAPVINDPADGQSATDRDARNASDEHRPDADGAHAATGETGEVTRHDPISKYTPPEPTGADQGLNTNIATDFDCNEHAINNDSCSTDFTANNTHTDDRRITEARPETDGVGHRCRAQSVTDMTLRPTGRESDTEPDIPRRHDLLTDARRSINLPRQHRTREQENTNSTATEQTSETIFQTITVDGTARLADKADKARHQIQVDASVNVTNAEVTEGHTVGAVHTRQQTKQTEHNSDKRRHTSESTLTDDTDTETPTDSDTTHDEFRRLSQMNTDDSNNDTFMDQSLESNIEFLQAQTRDPGLQTYWTRARANGSEFVVIRDMLYRKTPVNVATEMEYLLVVPKEYEKQILEMAHDSRFGGHSGVKKTLSRIQAVFWFPKMRQKIKGHVKACKQCQLVAPIKKKDRSPLQQPEVLSKYPFEDLTIDLLGSELPRSKRGNKFLLVIVCSVSRFVHAIPLRSTKAEEIADRLLEFFSLFSVPKVIRSDNASNFKSELFRKLREKLGISGQFSAPYHAMSHGTVERANLTLLNMLRKFAEANSDCWDKLLPYLLFSIRNVENESTKIPPNVLVFGRRLRGLLDVARDIWTHGDTSEKLLKMPTLKYLEKLNSDLETVRETARENINKAHEAAKRHYDRHSTVRELKAGQSVLVLQPSSGRKLTQEWLGPYQVIRRLENNNYEIQIGRRLVKLHINCLRKFVETEDETDGESQRVNVIITDSETEETETDGEIMTLGASGDGGVRDVTIGQQLSGAQRQAIYDLLSEYAELFTTEPGRTNLVEHKITTVDNEPAYMPSYRLPDSLRDEVEQELNRMLRNGVIEYNPYSNYNAPMIVVRKPSGAIRIVNNFTALNKKTQDEKYCMPNSQELLNRVAKGLLITRLDMTVAYYQIPLNKDSQHLTSFNTHIGRFVYKVLPMGMRTASISCQRLADILLRGTHRFAGSLMDDLLIFDMNFNDHLRHVREILGRLRQAGLTVNPKKCTIAANEIKILGHEIKDGKILPAIDKIKTIETWPKPQTKKHLKSFLGLISYFRDHVSHYAEIAYPLTSILGQAHPNRLKWTERQQTAFDTLRKALISRPVLQPPNENKPFKLYADSSKFAISSILIQEGDENPPRDHAISYASRQLLDRETRYSTVEKEMLALVWGLQKFRPWVYGRQITVLTDHKPLIFTDSLVKYNQRLARWLLQIQEYNITTAYVPGREQLADHMTRLSNYGAKV